MPSGTTFVRPEDFTMCRCRILTATCVMSMILCVGCQAKHDNRRDLHRFSWMVGTWVRDSDGVRSEESWSPPADGVMHGTNRTIADG
jgi:hypothetical protein